MLPSAHRMRNSVDFSSAVRDGRKVRRGSMIVHVDRRAVPAEVDEGAGPAIVGFVVGKSVGGSVVRHRVSRRLRGVVAARLAVLPAGSATVIRALPSASGATSAQLATDLDAALDRLVRVPR